MFANPITGGWWSRQQVSKAFARARDHATAAGMVKRSRIHELRHTHAAWLLTDGVPLPAVSCP
ncbi:tyrosine-type recombinase/integrase [Actinosynnema sp. NPDC059335]|uniref:tyrosine-type recombinase/integrase n=1 Tax=Actinosynnema sp. NPDC059335 TaxID=3346804 RepID=UPI00366E1B93